jgi:hypothetical protein
VAWVPAAPGAAVRLAGLRGDVHVTLRVVAGGVVGPKGERRRRSARGDPAIVAGSPFASCKRALLFCATGGERPD